MSSRTWMPTQELRAFTTAHARELVRDRRATIAILVSFVLIIVALAGIDLLIASTTNAPVGLLRSNVCLVSATGFMAVSFVSTSVPLVRYRSLGILRQLSTTPARRATFLIGHVPVRMLIIGVQTVIILAIIIAGDADTAQLVPLALTLLLGGAMLISLGYLLAARMVNVDLALQLAYIIPLIVLVSSGALFPLKAYPDAVEHLFRLLPTTWFVDLLSSLINDVEPMHPIGIMWTMLALTSVCAGCLAWHLFRWGERN